MSGYHRIAGIVDGSGSLFMWHVAPGSAYGDIRTEGLVPRNVSRGVHSGPAVDAVYLFEDEGTAEDGVVNWMLDSGRFDGEDEAVFLKVDVAGLALEDDPELAGSRYTTEHIPPDRIVEVKPRALD